MSSLIDPASIFVINLDRCVDRLETFHGRNTHLGPVRRFPAVHGASMDRQALQAKGLIAADLDYSDGALGCALSHVALWQEIAAGTRPITVCEDDAVFAHDFVMTAEARLAALPAGWDIVLWGWNFDSCLILQIVPGRPACLMHAGGHVTVEDLAAVSQAPASSQLFRVDQACGTLGYTISPAGAARMLAHCMPLRPYPIRQTEEGVTLPNIGIDLMMSTLYPRLQAYICVPPLVISPNLKTDSTTMVMDSDGLRRNVGRLTLTRLSGVLDMEDTDPATKASFYKAWIDANRTSGQLPAAWVKLAHELVRTCDHASALTALQNALALKPEYEPATSALALLLTRSSK